MKLKGTSLAGSSTTNVRVDDDFYATDPNSVREFLDVSKISGASFYEPCCGQGHISKVLKEYFPNADHFASDLVDRGYGTGSIDFLRTPIASDVDWIITNPPFTIAKEFVDTSLKLTNVGVAMFLKIQFLEGKARKDWFQQTPLKYVYVFSSRQAPFRDGAEVDPKTGKKWGSTMCFAWYVWEHGYSGEPTIRWL